MTRVEVLQRTVQIPENVKVQVEGRNLSVEGPLGLLYEDLSHLPISIIQGIGQLEIITRWPRKREIGMLGTATAQVRNMIRGVTNGYRYSLRTVYAHFPVTVKVDEKVRTVKIENFTGEKTPRFARILEGTRVTVKGEEITVEGPDLKNVSQTAANIQNATRIKKKDLRVFLDGIYVFHKSHVQGATG